MKQWTVYGCEMCKFESKDKDEVEAHEASHFNLTLEEFKEYKQIKENVRYASSALYTKNNEKTRKEFDEAVDKLSEFENKHNIKSTGSTNLF